MDSYFIRTPQFVDEHGNELKRTKYTHPYSYDGFVVHDNRKSAETTGTVYSDRMFQRDYAKYNTCRKKSFGDEGQYFYDASLSQIQNMLRLYFDAPNLLVTLVMEYCNVSNGYPTWRFDYHS